MRHNIQTFRPVFWWAGAILLVVAVIASPLAASALRQGLPVQVGEWELDTVDDWEEGIVNGLLISNNAGGELRLDSGQDQGIFISEPFSTPFTINAVGAYWRAQFPTGTNMVLEVRGRSSEPPEDITSDTGWGAWHPLEEGEARSVAENGAFAAPDVLPFPPDTDYLQVRIRFISDLARASAVLSELTVVYLNTTAGPPTSAGLLERRPILGGPSTLTTPPEIVPRTVWNRSQAESRPERVTPRGVVIHQIDVTSGVTETEDIAPGAVDTFSLLRALTNYQTEVLDWNDLVYHYVIDEAGVLYEGRSGGPTAAVSRLAGGDPVVHVAMLGDLDTAPSETALETLVDVLAWVSQAYDIAPLGQHEVAISDDVVVRQNITTHSDVSPIVTDPGEALREVVPDIRERVDRAIVRSRWYFLEGNNQDYVQQLAFLNPGAEATEAIIQIFPGATGEEIRRRVLVPANGRASFSVSEVVSDTTDLPFVVEASEEIIASQTMSLPTDIDIGPGANETSRVWYFAEGSTRNSFSTFLLLYNPQTISTDVTITYMRDEGSQVAQQFRLPAQRRVAINVAEIDGMADASFGMQIVASQPIVAERTMRFGAESTGLHNSPGIPALSERWYFAEGSTQGPFDMRLLLLNPNQQSAVADVTYMTPDGTEATRRYAIPRMTQLVVDVNEFVPELGVATMVEANRPLAAERAMYFIPPDVERSDPLTLPRPYTPLAGMIGTGAVEPAYSWRFADARTLNASQFLLLSNPSRGQARVTVEFVLSNGERSTETIVMPPSSRFTLPVHSIYPDQAAIATIVRSTQPIVAERSLFPEAGPITGGGTTTLGVPGQ
jgi:hypothetical protein